jgi:hypothetical protein
LGGAAVAERIFAVAFETRHDARSNERDASALVDPCEQHGGADARHFREHSRDGRVE